MRNIAEIIEDDKNGKKLSQTERQIAVVYIQGKYDAVMEISNNSKETRWIPVSERLPKKTGWYLITFKIHGGFSVCEMCYRKPENYWTQNNILQKVFDCDEVVAWMPLPEPYKPQESGDKE